MINIVLQNAYMRTEDSARRLKSWLEDLNDVFHYKVFRSLVLNTKTGMNLEKIFGHDIEDYSKVRIRDSTPEVGIGSSSKLKPNPDYIKKFLEHDKPKIVVACGMNAAAVSSHFSGPILQLPHPAARFLSNKSDFFDVTKKLIREIRAGDRQCIEVKIDRTTGNSIVVRQLTKLV